MRVTVIGELNIDLIISGQDLIPEWNREKLLSSFAMVLGSSSAITACKLAGLGLSVNFIGLVGNDDFGTFCIRELEKKGVGTEYVKRDPGTGTGVTLSFSTKTDRGLLTYMGTIPLLTPSDLQNDLLDTTDHIHFGSYYLQDGMREHWPILFQEAKKKGISTSFDTGWDIHQKWYKDKIMSLLEFTDFFMPSEDELKHIFPNTSLNSTLQQLAKFRKYVTVKRGGRGAVMLAPDGNVSTIHAYDIIPIDTTGAGDSFNAGFIYSYLTGNSAKEALRFSNACGAIATQHIGGAEQLASLQDVNQFMQNHQLKNGLD